MLGSTAFFKHKLPFCAVKISVTCTVYNRVIYRALLLHNAEHPVVKLQSLIHTQLSLFKMQIETTTYTIRDEFAFPSQIVRGELFRREKKSFSVLESVLHRWPAPPPRTRTTNREAGRRGKVT